MYIYTIHVGKMAEGIIGLLSQANTDITFQRAKSVYVYDLFKIA